jgi:hypothetical protein
MSKIVENDRNLLKDALVEYNAIKEEAIKVAKDRLAKTMPDVIENFLKEEMEKAMMDEAGIISTDETMIDDQESSVMETMKDVDSPVAEGDEHDHEDHMEDHMEIEEEMSDLDDDLTAEAIEEALKELDEMEMNEEELDEHNISFEVDFDEDSFEIKNIEADGKELDDIEFELDLEDEDMSDEVESEDDSEIELEVSDDEVEMEDESEEDLEEEMDLEDIDLDSLEEEEVEESLSHVITHQNAKQAGSHNHVNYQKEKNLRPGVKAESKLKADLNKVLKENEELRQINLEFKDALNKYKTQLYEMAVFNANLSHVNNLFVEHTTSTDEKKEILSKYKSVSTIEESKKLYSEFANKLNESKSNKKTIEEMVSDSRNGDSGSQKLNESISQPSTNDGIKAIKYMMNYIENKRK